MGLQAILYSNSTASPAYERILRRTSNFRILWSIPGGTQTIEFDHALSDTEAFDFFASDIGKRVVLADQFLDRPVAEGNIYTIDIVPQGAHVVARGFWARHFDEYYVADPTDTWSTSDLIDDAISTYVPALSNTTSGIHETNTVIGVWEPPDEGIFPGDLIVKMGALSDSDLETVASDTVTIDTDNDFSTTDGTDDRERYAQKFTPTKTGTVSQVKVKLKKTGSPNGKIRVNVPESLGGLPTSTRIGNLSTAVNASSLTTSYVEYTFTWNSGPPRVIENRDYFLLVRTLNYTYADGVTEIIIGSDADGGSGNLFYKKDPDADPEWTLVGANHSINYSIAMAGNKQWNYWVASEPFDGVLPQKPTGHFEGQVNSGDFDWQIRKGDLRKGSLTSTRDITQLANDVQVIFTMIGVTTDSGSWLTITSSATDSDSQDDYWKKEIHLTGGSLPEDSAGSETSAIADQYRDLYLDKFKEPMLRTEFTVSAPHIQDNYGSRWPLWTPIKRNGGYIKITDLFPIGEMLDESWNRKTTGQIMEMEYSSSTNELRVAYDLESNEVSAILARMESFL
jgi:hypothetical protein